MTALARIRRSAIALPWELAPVLPAPLSSTRLLRLIADACAEPVTSLPQANAATAVNPRIPVKRAA